jgi:lysophospholipase L1-like esterase
MKRWLLPLLFVLLSVLAALALGEAGLRIYFRAKGMDGGDVRQVLRRSRRSRRPSTGALSLVHLVQASPHDDIIYELRQGLDGTFKGKPVRTDAQGLRGSRDYALQKPPGTFRIAGLGDSVMFGWGVGEGETYLQIVERRLNEPLPTAPAAPGASARRRFEVLDFGVPGYNTAMEVATYEHRAAAFSPDLVLVHFIGNDFDLPHFMKLPKSRRSPLHWYLAELLRARFGPSRPEDEVDPDLLGHDRSDLPAEERAEVRGQYQDMVGESAFRRAMARLAALTRPRGIPVVVMALGGGGGNGKIARETAEANGFRFLDASPRFYDYLVAHGLEGERQNWVKVFRIPHDGHPNALGHQLYAEVVMAELEERGIAPR